MWRSEVGAICLMGTRCLLANAYEKDFCFGQTITCVHSHSRSWSNVLTLAILLWSILVEIIKLLHVIFYDNSFRMFFFFLVLWLLKNGTCMFVFITQLLLGTIKSESQHTVVCVNSIIDILAVSSAVLCLSPQCVLSFYEPDEIL